MRSFVSSRSPTVSCPLTLSQSSRRLLSSFAPLTTGLCSTRLLHTNLRLPGSRLQSPPPPFPCGTPHGSVRVSQRCVSSTALADRLAAAVARKGSGFAAAPPPSSTAAHGAGAVSASSATAASSTLSARMTRRASRPGGVDSSHDVIDADKASEDDEVPHSSSSNGGGGGASAEPAARLSNSELCRLVGARLAIPASRAAYVLEQARQGATVPFLARYRQDETGGLDEGQLRAVMTTAEEVKEVHRRRQFMLKSLEQRDLLTEERRRALQSMVHVSQLEDFWEPFKVKKTSLAGRARDAGLSPLADTLLGSTEPLPSTARQTIHSVEDGERLFVALLAEGMQRCETARQEILTYTHRTAYVTCTLVKSARKRAAKEMREADFDRLKEKYAFYDGKRWPVRHMTSHVVLALQRGEAKGVLRVDLTAGEHCPHIFRRLMKEQFAGVASRLGPHDESRGQDGRGRGGGSSAATHVYTRYEMDLLRSAMDAAYEYTVKAVAATLRRDLKKSAEQEAIAVFAHNLRHLLLQRPLAHARVLAMDPGVTNGVKCVALSETGDVLAFFKCTLMDEHRMMEYIAKIVESKKLNKIVIGNGTASQQTAHLVAKTIKRQNWRDVEFAVVSEAGASVYSVSDIAKEEFPTLDIMYRGAISIGRRVLDPLSELVKIPVRSMGIGMYQHDVNEKELLQELQHVVESCVALVGVNSASTNRYVMEKVPGIQKKLVDQIVLSRHAKRLGSREDLRRVPGMTETVFKQVAGFFRFPNSAEPLDNTNIHPESYPLVRRLMELYDRGELGWCVGGPSPTTAAAAPPAKEPGEEDALKRRQVGVALSSLSEEPLRGVSATLGCGVGTLRLVARELLSPALDPRATLPHAGLLRKEIREVKDLKAGDTLVGVVQSITTFGAFVDCGLHESVLVRGSEVVDELQVGALLQGIVFHAVDRLGRPQVTYTPPRVREGVSRQAAGSGLKLEADDALIEEGEGGLVASRSLSAHLAKAKAAVAAAAAATTTTTAPQVPHTSVKRPRQVGGDDEGARLQKVAREENPEPTPAVTPAPPEQKRVAPNTFSEEIEL